VGPRGSLHPAPRPAGEQPRRRRAAPHYGSDLVEGRSNISWSTNASRSAGASVSSTTWAQARPGRL